MLRYRTSGNLITTAQSREVNDIARANEGHERIQTGSKTNANLMPATHHFIYVWKMEETGGILLKPKNR